MTSEHHAKQLLANWLEDQPATAPSWLLDNVLSDVGQTPQRGHWMAAVRSLPMFSQNAMRLYGVAAVILLFAVLAFSWWPRQQSVGPVGPSQAPTASPVVTAPPSAVPSAPSTASPSAAENWSEWQPRGFFVDATIEWPDFGGWYTYQEGSTFAVIGNIDGQNETTYDTFGITPGAEPYVDPCASVSALERVEVGPTVDDLVNAMLQIPVNVSAVTETTVAGYPAKQLTFTAPEPRPGCEDGEFQLWRWPEPFGMPAPVGPIGSTTAYVMDVDGTRVMVTIEDRGTAEDSARLQRMLEALTIAPAAAPTPSPAGPQWVRWELNQPGFFVQASLDALDYRSPGQWVRQQIGSTFAVIYNDTGATYDTLNITPGAAPYVDPCAKGADRKLVDVGPSVDDLVRAMLKIKVDVSRVTDTQVGGFPAKQLTFTAPEPRPGCDNGEFQLWQWPDPFAEAAPVGPIGKTTVYVVDVAGTRVLVTIEDRGTAEDSALLQHMLDSLKFTP